MRYIYAVRKRNLNSFSGQLVHYDNAIFLEYQTVSVGTMKQKRMLFIGLIWNDGMCFVSFPW